MGGGGGWMVSVLGAFIWAFGAFAWDRATTVSFGSMVGEGVAGREGPGGEGLLVEEGLVEGVLGLGVVGEGAEEGGNGLGVPFWVWIVEEEVEEVEAVVKGVGGGGEGSGDVMFVLAITREVCEVCSEVGGERGSGRVVWVKGV